MTNTPDACEICGLSVHIICEGSSQAKALAAAQNETARLLTHVQELEKCLSDAIHPVDMDAAQFEIHGLEIKNTLLKAEVERLSSALKKIIHHQEFVGGPGLAALSTTAIIAKEALKGSAGQEGSK